MADTKISSLGDLAAEPASDDLFVVVDTSATATKRLNWSVIKALFPTHALATAASDFLVASGAGAWVKKTLAETIAILSTATPTATSIPQSDADKRIDPAWMTETIEIIVLDNDTELTVEDGIGSFYFVVPARWDGWNVLSIHAGTPGTASSSGTPTIQIHNLTDAADILSTLITIDASEYTSYTAATAPVVDTDHDDLATGDRLRVDCDVAGTGTKGLSIIITAGKP